MNLDQLKNLFKEWLLESVAEDEEVKALVLEIIMNNSETIMEGIVTKNMPKEPSKPELYDRLLLISQGKENPFKYEGNKIEVPNHGLGFKSKKKIEEWTNKAYSKLGGSWIRQQVIAESSPDTLTFFQDIFGGSSAQNQSRSQSTQSHPDDDKVIKKALEEKGQTHMMLEDGSRMDITSLLLDTAKTTFRKQPLSHDSQGSQPADMAASIVAEKTPEEMFGTDMAGGGWAKLAFQTSKN